MKTIDRAPFEKVNIKQQIDRLRSSDRTCRHNVHDHCMLTHSPHYTRIVQLCDKRPGCGYEKREPVVVEATT